MSQINSAAFARQRQMMVDCQLRPFDVTDLVLIDRMNHVPREAFLPETARDLAYSDAVLTVAVGGEPRALLAPMVLARLIQALRLRPEDRVLDVGGAFGYSAAVMAGLAGTVLALESDAACSASASAAFAAGGLTNAEAITGPLAAGCPGKAPFDVILVNGAVESGLDALLQQLADGGRLACIEITDKSAHGSAGIAVIHEKIGGETGVRRLFSTSASLLPGFVRAPAFAF